MCNCGSNINNTPGAGAPSPGTASNGVNRTFQQIKQTREIVKKMWEDAGMAGRKARPRTLDQVYTHKNTK